VEKDCYLVLKNLEKKHRVARRSCAAALGDLREVIGEFVFFDDEKVIFIRLDQPKVVEALHKQADPWSRRAHHLGQLFMGNLQLDANAARIFLAPACGRAAKASSPAAARYRPSPGWR
jgi:hypothetical protein